MSKQKTKKEWIELFKKYESGNWDWDDYYAKHYTFHNKKPKFKSRYGKRLYRLQQSRARFRKKYKKWKLLDNLFMENKNETRGRKKKIDIDEIISNLTEKEKKDIIKRYFEITKKKDKKKEANTFNWTPTRKSYIFRMHRTSFYKKKKTRSYKFDCFKKEIINTFYENKCRYGSKRLSEALKSQGIIINDRTLRHYMIRWELKSITRVAKRQGEKRYKLFVPDLVKRDYHGKRVNAKATDVSYISANESQNFVFLSATIDHKTKYVHYSMSKNNDLKLVMDTQKQIKDNNYILHSDHAWQYFQKELLDFNKKRNILSSMKGTTDPLDNREIEYFFSCIKTECLYHLPTQDMKFKEIESIVKEYINWYNEKRIQKILKWKTPTEASAYEI